MRITDIRCTLVNAGWRNWTYVQVYTDDGFVGLGEGTVRSREHAVVGAVGDMSRVLVGKDPRTITSHVQTLYRDFHKRGGVVMMSAIGGIEMALWDIVGQWLGQPIATLLGGRVRDEAWAYHNGWADGAADVDDLAKRAGDAVADGRVRALKWNPFAGLDGWPTPPAARRAVAAVRAVREAVGDDVELMIEAHGLFAPAAAVRMTEALAPMRPFWFEEPIPPEDVASMARVRERSAIAIAAGERLFTRYEFADLIEARAVDIL
ncbi:MAG TPA: enolase C-terminal domain-like protein, partial [Candidatus Limnocylindrales bacterium]|nr:enolase C-terminal domain-like protein [Candidatus Limnocylindrales bacterium]